VPHAVSVLKFDAMGFFSPLPPSTAVMAGLVPAIHAGRLGLVFGRCPKPLGVDARDEPGHDIAREASSAELSNMLLNTGTSE